MALAVFHPQQSRDGSGDRAADGCDAAFVEYPDPAIQLSPVRIEQRKFDYDRRVPSGLQSREHWSHGLTRKRYSSMLYLVNNGQ